MKVMFISRWVGSHKGGTETHVRELARGLAQRGHDVTILTMRGEELAFNRFKKINVAFVDRTLGETYLSEQAMHLRAAFFLVKALIKFLRLSMRGSKPDIISVHYALEAVLAKVIRRVFGIPFVFVFEGYTHWEAKVATNADVRIAISQDIAAMCRRRWGYEPQVIPPVADLAFPDKKDPIGTRKREGFRILTVCQLIPRKDLATLLRAVHIALSGGIDLKAVIVGDGPARKEIESLRDSLALNEAVFLRGDIDQQKLLSEYRNADAFVLPSVYEGFGIVFIEAMRAGLPIISTTSSAIPEVVGDAGILIPPRDPERLADAIATLATSPPLRKRLSVCARQRARNFDPAFILPMYEEAFQSGLKRPTTAQT